MLILYDLIFILFALFCLPVYLFKRKLRHHFLMRLGVLPKEVSLLKDQMPIWLHAVSVGEVMAGRSLIDKLKKRFPHKKLIISTVTTTGNNVAQSLKGKDGWVIYLPLDISFITRAVIKRIRPCLFIAMETEIWPNLISTLRVFGVPIVLLNGRISNKSFKGYQKIKILLKPLLEKIDLFCMQTQTDAKRIISLGAPQDKVKITGNMKFDITDYTDYTDYKEDYTGYRLKLGFASLGRLLVAGSTHPPEEEIILNIYEKISKEFTDLKLLIAPRHPERTPELERLITKYSFQPLRISQLNKASGTCNSESIFILDTIGQLIYFYAISDIVFVGGSMVNRGGHNIIEPALFSKPIIFGPYMSNFKDVTELFLNKDAAISVRNKDELYNSIKALLANQEIRESLGHRAKSVVEENRGATERSLAYINEKISL